VCVCVCVYVCIEHYVCADVRAWTVLRECIVVLWSTRQFLVARRTGSVIATDHELSAAMSSTDPVRNRRNFFVHIAVSDSKRWRGCVALLNVDDCDWWLLQEPG